MAVTLHTTAGDIKLELLCQQCPKTCENFLALCASGYYDNCIFHRNIKSFMVQTGDPTSSGKAGQSIWGEPFEDELHADIKHDTRGIVSMASNGPNTNRVIDGFDALEELENIKVDAKYKPVVEQKIRSVTIHANPIAENVEKT
uniref:Peptidyl-prolyl cis-trans isomerase n=1 Tax=Ditylenchus dipsaci TaxID=166011 RepID=A0A915DJE3_9BILA